MSEYEPIDYDAKDARLGERDRIIKIIRGKITDHQAYLDRYKDAPKHQIYYLEDDISHSKMAIQDLEYLIEEILA